MSETELKAAAERLLNNCWDSYLDPATSGEGSRDWFAAFDPCIADGRLLARAWKAERDETRVSAEWLESIGGETVEPGGILLGDVFTYRSPADIALWSVFIEGRGAFPPLKTRGEFRTLFRLRGIGLKETLP